MAEQKYKVEVLVGFVDEREFQQQLNKEFNTGWKLHSITAQPMNDQLRTIVVYEKN